MTAIESSRRVLPGAVAGLALNLLCWVTLLSLAPRISDYPFPQMQASGHVSQDMPLDMAHCFDCPAFSALGKEFGSTWDPLPVKVFLLANSPALWAARGPEGPAGMAPVSPLILLVVSSTQWLVLGAFWRLWRASRSAKQPPSMVQA